MGKLAKRVDAHVGGRIRDRRTSLGLTQEHLANALNISYQQVQKYETGANRVSAGRLYEVARILQSEVSYFFEGLNEHVEAEPLGHGGKNRSTIELVRNFGAIDDPSIRAAVSGLVKSIAKPEKEYMV
ncbi:MAG: helix-turn-helix transcriptional regulator [Alphaproteobacteria bacterium]|jgi:transcriptional regulator with XRE-family HTH domain|nr:helix-turn-helix transcriptional regulator [Alphaproteobacteria bacterium]|tara:strand:- start:46 stop:429 length:384 start_codon:yes stop_codon:yes gene_type:complete